MEDRWSANPFLKDKLTGLARDSRKAPTASEDLLWQALRRKPLGVRIRRQQPIGPFIVDFYCSKARLVVEIECPIHQIQHARDQDRQALLESLGLRLLRFSVADVENDIDFVVSRIHAEIRRVVSPLP